MRLEESDGGVYTIYLGEVFDFKNVEAFRKAYEPVDLSKVKQVKISFLKTRYMDSSALGMLLNVKNHFKPSGAIVKIVQPNEQIKKILSISRFDQRFTIE